MRDSFSCKAAAEALSMYVTRKNTISQN